MADRSPQPNARSRGRDFIFPPKFWLLACLSGVGAGIGGGLLMKLLEAAQKLSYSYKSGGFLDGVARVSGTHRVLVLAAAGVLAIIVRAVVQKFGGFSGTDLSESIWFRSGTLPLLRTVIKAILSIVLVGMGVSLGREGALKQTGAAIASKLSELFHLPAAQKRLLVACAAGAGMAAAYNVPFGGAIFAVEVLLGTLSLPLILPAMATSFIATGVSWILLPDKPTYSIPHFALHSSNIYWALLAGPLLGLGAFLWIRLIAWADAATPKGWKAYVAPVVVFTLLGVAAIGYPDILGNGKGVVQRAYLDKFDMQLLLPLLGLKLIAAPGCLGTGTPGGLFTPTLTVGALLGGVLGHLWTMAVPSPELGVFAIVGSAAVLAAATQGPISSIAFVIELTRRVDSLMVPMLLAVVGASLVTQALDNRSIYSARVKAGMEAAKKTKLSGTSFDRLGSDDFAVATSAAVYATILHRLLEYSGPLFVVDQKGNLLGQVHTDEVLARDLGAPRSITTAADMLHSVTPLCSTMSEREVLEQLKKSPNNALPVVDSRTGKLIGAVKKT